METKNGRLMHPFACRCPDCQLDELEAFVCNDCGKVGDLCEDCDLCPKCCACHDEDGSDDEPEGYEADEHDVINFCWRENRRCWRQARYDRFED